MKAYSDLPPQRVAAVIYPLKCLKKWFTVTNAKTQGYYALYMQLTKEL